MDVEFFHKNKEYLLIALGIFILALGVYIIKDYLTALLGAAFLAYLLYPVYTWIKSKIKNENAAASIVLIIFIAVFAVPLFFIARTLVSDVQGIYNFFINSEVYTNESFRYIIENTLSYLSKNLSGFAVSLTSKIISLVVMMFALFYFLKEGENIIAKIKEFLPLNRKHKEEIIEEFKRVTYAVIYGITAIALLQGILAIPGFYIFDVKSPIFFSLLVIRPF